MKKLMLNILVGFISLLTLGVVVVGGLLVPSAVNEFFVKNNVYEIILICIYVVLVCVVINHVGEHIRVRYTEYIFEKGRKKYTSKVQFSTDILRYIKSNKQYEIITHNVNNDKTEEIMHSYLVENTTDKLFLCRHKVVFVNNILTKDIYIFNSLYSNRKVIVEDVEIDTDKYSTPREFWENEMIKRRDKILEDNGYKAITI